MTPETPHIKLLSDIGFADTVLMPGDPLRSRFIAQNFLDDAVLVNDVRGIQGYTGFYKGKKVSVMASGMGMPSMGIYSYELYKFFGVSNIIRIGSAGALSADTPLRSIVVATAACTNSNFGSQYGMCGTVTPAADFGLLCAVKSASEKENIPFTAGLIFSSDTFYNDSHPSSEWAKVGAKAVEMEAAALYMTASYLGKKALAICTISDNAFPPFDGLDSAERQTGFTDMMRLALETAVSL